MHCGGIWVSTQVYLEQKLSIEVLLYQSSLFQPQCENKNSYLTETRTAQCKAVDSASAVDTETKPNELCFLHYEVINN